MNKVLSCLKVKEDEIESNSRPESSPNKLRLATLRLSKVSSNKASYSPEKALSGHGPNVKIPIEKRNL